MLGTWNFWWYIDWVHPPPWFTVAKQSIQFYEGANANHHDFYC